MPTSQKPIHKPTAKDVPGSGMARKAGDSIEHRRAQQKEVMRSLFGSNKKKDKK